MSTGPASDAARSKKKREQQKISLPPQILKGKNLVEKQKKMLKQMARRLEDKGYDDHCLKMNRERVKRYRQNKKEAMLEKENVPQNKQGGTGMAGDVTDNLEVPTSVNSSTPTDSNTLVQSNSTSSVANSLDDINTTGSKQIRFSFSTPSSSRQREVGLKRRRETLREKNDELKQLSIHHLTDRPSVF